MARPRRRRGAHLRPQHPAIFDSAAHRAAAKRADVSHSRAGREVERAGSGVGDPILFCVRPSNHPETFELAGHLVGLREDGFAVEYEEPGQAIGQWIDALQTAEPTASPPAAEPTGSAS